MSIRSNTLPTGHMLSPQLQDVLRRNGMTAGISARDGRLELVVKGHDSPLLRYPVTPQQLRMLAEGGTNFTNKRAYNTFAAIVAPDFHLPKDWIHARSVNSRVVMGLHGYREDGPSRYDYLGWTPRQQPGFHMRRLGGQLMTPQREDGYRRPGELQSGAYGFYYKGSQGKATATSQGAAQVDVLQELRQVIQQPQVAQRPTQPAIPYREAITSDVYFSTEKWQEVLQSHGIHVDASQGLLTVHGTDGRAYLYDLTPQEVHQLTSNDLREASVPQRLDIINGIIAQDFQSQITLEDLNSRQQPDLQPSMQQVTLQQQTQAPEQQSVEEENASPQRDPEKGYVDGQALRQLNEAKGWYREGSHGREVEVSDIWVESRPQEPEEGENQQENRLQYSITAVINGQAVTHELSRKDYDKFMNMDDYHRMKMVSKVFDEVDMKTRPGMRMGLAGALAAGLQMAREATWMTADIAHGIEHIRHPHSPEIYQEVHGTAHIYAKPGVDSPQALAQRAFEAGMAVEHRAHTLGR